MEVNDQRRYFLEADIEIQEETKILKEAASSVIKLPKDDEKQADLLYFTAIFVSSGCNLNKAYFLPSELVKAEGTIINKALDIEHSENEIIGHIYERAFTDMEGNPLNVEELSSTETASLDKKDMHVQIAGIIYKNRFSEIAKEVSEGKWKVSMEAYFMDYDIKVGDLIMSRKEAEFLGLATDESMIGRSAKVIKGGIEVATGNVVRVLRDLLFSGCGIVENPANPPSVVLETANKTNKGEDSEEIVILNYDKHEEDNNVTFNVIDGAELEQSELIHKDTVGICVNFKKYVYDNNTSVNANSTIIHEKWCTRYDSNCPTMGGDATSPDCLINKVEAAVTEVFNEISENSESVDRINILVDTLKSALKKAAKFL